MEPILKSHFVNFKSDFEIDTKDDAQKEASAFERFVNYVLLSIDYPDAFTADPELLEFVSVGGSDDTFIDGIGIAINDRKPVQYRRSRVGLRMSSLQLILPL